MIMPIYVYGFPVLKKVAEPISSDYPELSELIENMYQTMYNAKGVGLAAPQVGLSKRIFVVDTIQVMKEEDKHKGIKKVFINPQIIEETGTPWSYEEGCLSIPNIHGDVERPAVVTLTYVDENFQEFFETYEGMNARVIQHEYDHIQGKLFIEKLKPLKKKLIQGKLNKMAAGNVTADYKIKVYKP
ncbi:MAG: peptide deformylase [Saprospiraceae bacterium]|nr:peptide deformylase [Saprospiraceae bacterium]